MQRGHIRLRQYPRVMVEYAFVGLVLVCWRRPLPVPHSSPHTRHLQGVDCIHMYGTRAYRVCRYRIREETPLRDDRPTPTTTYRRRACTGHWRTRRMRSTATVVEHVTIDCVDNISM
jgi:hypothetical protein